MIELARPRPPHELLLPEGAPDFKPAPEVEDWLRACFIDDGAVLENPDHAHLREAEIGVVWTSVYYQKQGRDVAGTCELVQGGNDWKRARGAWQIKQWCGGRDVDFLLTFYAPYARGASDEEWCALVEHELYHAGQKLDLSGMPAFNKDTGEPIFGLRGHDVEEHLGVVRRYGTVTPALREMVELAGRKPEVALADVRHACGVCLRLAA